MGVCMELVPSERAVLRQIRDLYLEASVRTYRVNVLTRLWPVTHFEAYRAGYAGLVSKGLIQKSSDELSFSITTSGLQAMV